MSIRFCHLDKRTVFLDNPVVMTRSLAGRIEEFNLVDVVSVINQSAMDGVLKIETDDEVEGVLAFWKGKLVHGAYGNISGDDAAAHILSWRHGSFFFTSQRWSGVPTIKSTFSQLLIDHAIKMDEDAAKIGHIISGTTKIRLKLKPESIENLQLEPDEWNLLSQTNGSTSVAQVVGSLGLSNQRTREILGKLIKIGLIEIVSEPA